MNEALTKAIDSCDFVVSDLQEALHKAKAVDGLVVLGLIDRAAKLKIGIEALLNAWESDNKAVLK